MQRLFAIVFALLMGLGLGPLAAGPSTMMIVIRAPAAAGIVPGASASYASTTSTNTYSVNITTTQTANLCYVFSGHYYRAAGAITSVAVTLDGTSGLTATVANDGLDDYVVGGSAGYFLTRVLFSSKSTGTYACVITFNASVTDVVWGVKEFAGVNQTTPLSTLTGFTGGASTTPSATISSATGEVVFMHTGHDFNMTSAGSGDTIVWDADSAGNPSPYMFGEGLTSPGAASVTVSGTISSSAQWGGIICRINPAP